MKRMFGTGEEVIDCAAREDVWKREPTVSAMLGADRLAGVR
jgi:hypothetical protein